MEKNKLLTTILATIPGCGHFYLGLWKEGLRIIGFLLLAFVLEMVFIYPLFVIPNENFLLSTPLGNFIDFILHFPLWGLYGWSIGDAYRKADKWGKEYKKI
ncbi:MAG: hypothetical protein ACPLXP_02180 [Microgenomates group bacterium]